MQTPHCRALSAARKATASAAASTGQSSRPSSTNEPQPRPLPSGPERVVVQRQAPRVGEQPAEESARHHAAQARSGHRRRVAEAARRTAPRGAPAAMPRPGERGEEGVAGAALARQQGDVGERLDVLHQGRRAADARLERSRAASPSAARARRRWRGPVRSPRRRRRCARRGRPRPGRPTGPAVSSSACRIGASHGRVGDVDDARRAARPRGHQPEAVEDQVGPVQQQVAVLDRAGLALLAVGHDHPGPGPLEHRGAACARRGRPRRHGRAGRTPRGGRARSGGVACSRRVDVRPPRSSTA